MHNPHLFFQSTITNHQPHITNVTENWNCLSYFSYSWGIFLNLLYLFQNTSRTIIPPLIPVLCLHSCLEATMHLLGQNMIKPHYSWCLFSIEFSILSSMPSNVAHQFNLPDLLKKLSHISLPIFWRHTA